MKNPKDKLICTLEELIKLLDSDGVSHWSAWMKSAKERISRDDSSGLQKLLSAYGGMGSFNDLIVGQRTSAGKFEWKPGAQELNGRLEKLRNEAYDLAVELRAPKNQN